MKASLPGVLERAADRLDRTRDAKDLAFMLRELLRCLRLLRGSPSKVRLFLDAWVDEDCQECPECAGMGIEHAGLDPCPTCKGDCMIVVPRS